MSKGDLQPIVVEGRNCWRIERAEKARMIVDAADYYALLEQLMADAKQRILLIGWDFDPRIALKPDKNGKGEPLGDYLLRLAHEKPDRDIDILRWNFGGLKQFAMPRILSMVARWKLTRSISFRLDSAASGRMQPSPEGRGVRRPSRGLRRHRRRIAALGYARSQGRRSAPHRA